MVCVNSHTISWPNTDPNRLILLTKFQRNVCFYVVNIHVRIYYKKTNNQAKIRKTGTRVGDGQKVKAGIQKSTKVLHVFKIGRISPWFILWKVDRISPWSFRKLHNWSLDSIITKSKNNAQVLAHVYNLIHVLNSQSPKTILPKPITRVKIHKLWSKSQSVSVLIKIPNAPSFFPQFPPIPRTLNTPWTLDIQPGSIGSLPLN